MAREQTAWQAAELARLLEGYDKGEPWSKVALDIGRTRNAVIGKAHRLRMFKGGEGKAVARAPRVRGSPSLKLVEALMGKGVPHETETDKGPAPAKAKVRNDEAPAPAIVREHSGGQKGVAHPKVGKAPMSKEPVDIHALRGSRCRWPLWAFGEHAGLYCGAGIEGLGPYCAEHARIAYTRKDQADDRRHTAVQGANVPRPAFIARR